MFVIPSAEITQSGIEKRFLVPYVKSPTEFTTLEFSGTYNNYLFVCDKSEEELKYKFSGANSWIKKFKNAKNKNGTETIQYACRGHRPFWYSLRPKQAHIVTAINPYERFLFSFSESPFTIDQRLVAITVNEKYDVELVAALLNSIVPFLPMEMRGTSRNLGALDLNANYFKTLRVLHLLLDVHHLGTRASRNAPAPSSAAKWLSRQLRRRERPADRSADHASTPRRRSARTWPSLTPPARRSSSLISDAVVVRGWQASDSTPPSETARRTSFKALRKRKAAARPPRSSTAIIEPGALHWRWKTRA